MRRRAVGLAMVVLACVALVGCGSDKKRLTAADLTAQGDAVCTTLDGDVKALADTFPVTVNFTPKQMQDFYRKIVPLVDKAVASFKALTPPKDLEKAYQSALTQIGIDRTTLSGATSSEAAAKNLFDTQVDPFTATNQKLAAAGITACGGTPPAGSATSSTSTPAAAASTTAPTSGSSATTAAK